ncbi:MAG: riboflavin biosynthesis protein RibF [Eubacteriales bacterium]|nr:riboflavin biosynthesis protein RibF [Eubacteriales bacterium]
MEVFSSLEGVDSSRERGIALGVFDGLHLGHRHILKELMKICKERSLIPTVFTFASPYGPEENRRLLDCEDKCAVMEELGIEEVFVAEMSNAFRSTSAEDFLKSILQDQLNVKMLVVGEDNRFGAGAEGDIHFLADYADENNLSYKVVTDVLYRNEKISSSRIRNYLSQGKVEDAAAMLTQPYKLKGVVERGRGIGTRKGFPTANFPFPAKRARLHDGVYATVVHCAAGTFCGISNIGVSPTLDEETPLRVETYLYEFDGSLYGEEIEVEFLSFFRPELRFDSMDELFKTLETDLENVWQWHQSRMVK